MIIRAHFAFYFANLVLRAVATNCCAHFSRAAASGVPWEGGENKWCSHIDIYMRARSLLVDLGRARGLVIGGIGRLMAPRSPFVQLVKQSVGHTW